MTDVPFTSALRGVLVALCACLLLWCQACSATPMQKARRGLATSMQVMQVVDSQFEPRYRAAMARVRSGEIPEDESVAFVRRWNIAGVAVAGAVVALHTAEATLDAIERGEEGDIAGVFSCVAVAFSKLLDELPKVGVDLPPEINLVMSIVMMLAGDRCTPQNHGSTAGIPSMSEAISMEGATP